jgi:hypothetical protein
MADHKNRITKTRLLSITYNHRQLQSVGRQPSLKLGEHVRMFNFRKVLFTALFIQCVMSQQIKIEVNPSDNRAGHIDCCAARGNPVNAAIGFTKPAYVARLHLNRDTRDATVLNFSAAPFAGWLLQEILPGESVTFLDTRMDRKQELSYAALQTMARDQRVYVTPHK